MSCLEKRSEGKWRLVISDGFDPVTGKRIKKRFPFEAKTEPKAKKLAAIIEGKYWEGKTVDNSNITVARHFSEWIDIHSLEIKGTTYENYTDIINAYIIPYFGNMFLQKVQPKNVEAFKLYLLKDGKKHGKGGLSKRFTVSILKLLNQGMKYAEEKKMVSENPCKFVKFPKPKKKKDYVILDAEGIDILLDVAKELYGLTMQAFLLTAIHTGLRRGELLALSWKNIDLENSSLFVVDNLVHTKKEGYYFTNTKTEESERFLGLTQDNVRILKKLKKEQAKNRLAYGDSYFNRDLVFCKEDGSIITFGSLRHKYKNIREKAKLSPRVHDLRHTHIMKILEGGGDLALAMHRAGHTTMKTTGDIYTHATKEIDRLAVEKFENAIRK